MVFSIDLSGKTVVVTGGNRGIGACAWRRGSYFIGTGLAKLSD